MEIAADFLCKFTPKRERPAGGIHRISSAIKKIQSELDGLKNVNVCIRYYKHDRWKALSDDQRKKCILTRQLQNGCDGS